MSKPNLNNIFNKFQNWLNDRNSGTHPVLEKYNGFLAPDECLGVVRPGQESLPNQHIPYPIQQIEAEIRSYLAAVVENLDTFNNAIEIGMGEFGGTHVLFGMVFDHVTTIEVQTSLVNNFNASNTNDTGSVLNTSSNAAYNMPQVNSKVFDMLFIDGDHSYNQTAADFVNYYPFIRPGGVIGFHDANNPKYGVKKLLQDLENGKVDGINHKIVNIFASFETGISFLIKP
jgi:predicted O-methyltransferase YrrM